MNNDIRRSVILEKVKELLRDEVNQYEEWLSNDAESPDLLFGRKQLAEGLLTSIRLWENENDG